MTLTAAQTDRARGVLLATAAGDALGAPYEFQPARGPELPVAMVGGGGFDWAPGEWTDDTSMAVAVAEVAADADLRDPDAQARIVRRWRDWALAAPDVGVQTRRVLAALGPDATAADAVTSARLLHERTGRSGGNGSLMRAAPLSLAFLADEDALVPAATAISALTHFDPEAGEACALWCLAMRHGVLSGELDVRRGLTRLAPDRAAVWAGRLDRAEAAAPSDFIHNGWVVEALQAAWCALAAHPDDLAAAVEAAVRSGNDTDTVAAIAGGLAGAVHGASAVPPAWRSVLHGWPGITGLDLEALADRVVAQSGV